MDLISKTKNIINKTASNKAGWKKFRKLYILILSLANKITIWKEWTIIISDNNIKWIQWSPEPSSKKRNNTAITPIQSKVHMNAQSIPKTYIFFNENFGTKYTNIYPVYISLTIWTIAILNINKLTCPLISLPSFWQEIKRIAKLIKATKPLVNNVDMMFFNKVI